MSSHKIFRVSKVNPFILLAILILILFIFVWVAKSIFKVLSLVAPVLFIAALIINYRVVVGYGKWLLASLKRNPLFGVLAMIFTVIGFPVVSFFLLFRALSSRGMADPLHLNKGEYIKFEEVDEDFLDISEIKEHKKKMDNDYNDVLT